MTVAAFMLLVSRTLALPASELEKPHKWVAAEQCSFVNPPVVPYYWDPRCNSNVVSLGCWADGVHNECRFCGEWPYTGIDCPEDAIVPDRKKCEFDNPPINTYMWDASCKEGDLGCLADGKHLGCRWCGFEQYENVTCPRDTCTFDNEPVTPYYWDSLCEMGMLGCNADGIHVQCRFCDHQPFNGVHCPPSARPNYPDGDCWFPVGTAQSHKWDKNCKWGILGCWADGVHPQCRYCGPGSGGIYESIECKEPVEPVLP